MKILKYRILGIFPLLFFSIKAIDCYNRNALFDLLWFCNITNLFLGLAISFGVLRFVWFFTLANLVGIAPWLFGLTIGIEFLYTSLLVHLVSPIIGIYILKKSDVKYQLWSYGFFLFIPFCKSLVAFLHPTGENVNIAFYVYPELIPYFFNYPVYWAANTIGLGISFYIIEKNHYKGIKIMVLVYLAFRQLMFKKANLIFMLLAIGFGLGFQWPNIANLTGYSVELIEKFVTKGVGHFIVYHKDRKGFITNEKLYQEIRSLISTKSIYARIRLPGLITEINETSTTQSVEILGMEKEEWELITNVPFFQPKTRHIPEILIGKQVKDATGFKDLPLVLKIVSIYNKKPIILKAKAVFVPEYGYSTEKQLILPLHILQKAIQRKNWITELGVISYSNFPKQTNDKLADPNMRTLHWSETNDFVRSAIRGNQILVIISSFMVMLGVAIPIMALLYIGVLEDRRNIALLSSLGVYKYKIFLIYFFRALLVAVLGCALGVLLGYGLLKYFLNYPIYKTPSFTILPVVSFYDFVYSVLIVFGVVLISGIYPAIRAYNLNPVVIFREE